MISTIWISQKLRWRAFNSVQLGKDHIFELLHLGERFSLNAVRPSEILNPVSNSHTSLDALWSWVPRSRLPSTISQLSSKLNVLLITDRDVLSRDINMPVLLTITASGLFSQIFLAHLRAVGINSSGGTTALTIPHSCIFWGEIGSPIKANSDARCRPSINNIREGNADETNNSA